MERGGYESDLNRLILYNRSTMQSTIPIHVHFDHTISSFVFGTAPLADATVQTIFLTCPRNGRHMIFHMQVDRDGKLRKEPLPLITQHHNSNVSVLSRDRLIFNRDCLVSPSELYSVSLSDPSQVRALTSFNAPVINTLQFGSIDEFYFSGALDEAVHAWLLRPVGWKKEDGASKKYPLAVIIHGGPQTSMDDHWHYRWHPQIYAAAGYAVLCINFHGSPGFGQKFTDSIRGDWGGKPFEDIMKGVAHTLKNYEWVDGNRMAALGASYGGYMINWLNGHTTQFKCLVNHCGIYSQHAMHSGTEEMFFTEWEMMGTPWTNKEMYDKFSPDTYAADWKTPTMVIHGGKDYRVPYQQGLQTFSTLQRLGVESEFLFFPDECHWVLNPANSVVWHENVISWLDRFCK